MLGDDAYVFDKISYVESYIPVPATTRIKKTHYNMVVRYFEGYLWFFRSKMIIRAERDTLLWYTN